MLHLHLKEFNLKHFYISYSDKVHLALSENISHVREKKNNKKKRLEILHLTFKLKKKSQLIRCEASYKNPDKTVNLLIIQYNSIAINSLPNYQYENYQFCKLCYSM